MKKIYVQAGQAMKKEVSQSLRKRHSIPRWALLLLALIVVPVFSEKFPGPQQPITGLAPAPLEATASLDPIAGIDVSKWQGPIDWQLVKESGIRFVIIKATEGTNYVDPLFVAHWDGAKKAGLLTSAYHMLWPNLSASEQAAHFLNTMRDRQPDFPLVLDVELRKGMGKFKAGAMAEETLLLLEESDGRKPIVYTAQSVWGEIVGWAPGWHKYPLWVAGYDTSTPLMPTGWEVYSLWQYDSQGKVPGISGNVDLNVFVGGTQDLSNLGR